MKGKYLLRFGQGGRGLCPLVCVALAAFLLGIQMGSKEQIVTVEPYDCPFSATADVVHHKDEQPEIEPAKFGKVNFNDERGCLKWVNSQHGEEKMLFNGFWSSPAAMLNGYYLELGAHDGVYLSNTLWLDKCLGWNGMLIEAHPNLKNAVPKNRPRADFIPEAICAEEGTIDFVGNSNGISGISDVVDKEFLKNSDPRGASKVFKVKCGPLHAHLAARDIKHIDFWSLDVEGAEWIVLNSFDWDAVTVHVLLIENDKDKGNDRQQRHDFLKNKNFEFRGVVGYVNELWVNPANARPGLSEIYYGDGWNGAT